MKQSSFVRRVYDHRLKNSVAISGNANLFPDLAIPKRTSSRWASRGRLSVDTAPEFGDDSDLVARLKALEARCSGLEATQSLIRDVSNIFEFSIDWNRLPDGEAKQKLIAVRPTKTF